MAKNDSKQEPLAERSLGIYDDTQFTRPASSPSKNLMKVLTRNPYEAFVLWKIDPKYFNQIQSDFGKPPESEIQMKLLLEYVDSEGKQESTWFEIPPLSKHYYCKFSSPKFKIRAKLFANRGADLRLALETGNQDLPPSSESNQLDEQWVHPVWRERGFAKQSKSGSWFYSESWQENESHPTFLWGPAEIGNSPSSHRSESV